MAGGLLQRLLTRSGVLPLLRNQWREENAQVNARLEKLDRDVRMLRETLALNVTQREKGTNNPGLFDPERWRSRSTGVGH
jgi:hypothetical protein